MVDADHAHQEMSQMQQEQNAWKLKKLHQSNVVIEKLLHGMVNHVLLVSHIPELKKVVPCVDLTSVQPIKLFHGLVLVFHVKQDNSQMLNLSLVLRNKVLHAPPEKFQMRL